MTLFTLVEILGLVAVACIVTYIVVRHSSRQALTELRREAESQMAVVKASIAALERQIQQLGKPAAAPSTAPAASSPATSAKPPAVQAAPQEITPELLVVMAAAVTTFLGKKVRIRSARALQSPYEIVNPWSQQGRVIVQASHNLRLGS